MKSLFVKKRRCVLAVMGLLSILSMLTGCINQRLDGPGMERLGAQLVNVTEISTIEGYWSEDSIGYVLEIFGDQVIVRKGIVQANVLEMKEILNIVI